MDANPATTSGRCDRSPSRHRAGWHSLAAGVLTIAFAFIIGNCSPLMRTWLPGFYHRPSLSIESSGKHTDHKNLPAMHSPAKVLTASWSRLRDKTYEELRFAERIFAVMLGRGLPDVDLRAQKEKIDDLRKRLEDYDTRLRELAEANAQPSNATPNEINPDELDVQHRQVMDQLHLQRIGPGQQ